jgi:hypothetical protein
MLWMTTVKPSRAIMMRRMPMRRIVMMMRIRTCMLCLLLIISTPTTHSSSLDWGVGEDVDEADMDEVECHSQVLGIL